MNGVAGLALPSAGPHFLRHALRQQAHAPSSCAGSARKAAMQRTATEAGAYLQSARQPPALRD